MVNPLFDIILNNSKTVKDRVIAIKEAVNLHKGDCAWVLLVLLVKPREAKGVQLAAKKGLTSIKEFLPEKIRMMCREIVFEKELKFFPKRAIAATLIGRLHAIEAAGLLLQIAQDVTENRYIRSSATEALGDLGFVSAIPSLLHFLGNESEDIRVRAAAAMALAWLHAQSAIPHLVRLLEHQEILIWMVAIDALAHFDQVSITEEIFNLYLKFIQDSDENRLNHIREALISRDLVLLLEKADNFRVSILKELILEQENVNLQQLEFIRDRTDNRFLRSHTHK